MSSPDWRLQPLRKFWQNVNWENRAIAPSLTSDPNNSDPNNNDGAPILSLLMSVQEYFCAISWTGIPKIAAPSPESKVSSNTIDESNETLADFLDDISKFF